MYQRLSILAATICAVFVFGFVDAEAGQRYRYIDGGLTLGGVQVSVGYDSYRGGRLFVSTPHDFYEHPRYRCGTSCRRVGRHVQHDFGCPRLTRFLHRNGYDPLDLVPSRYQAGISRYDDPYYRHGYEDDEYDDEYSDYYGYGRNSRYDDEYYEYRHRHGKSCDRRGGYRSKYCRR